MKIFIQPLTLMTEKKMLKINGAFECSLVLRMKVIFASVYIVFLLKDNAFLCAS